MKWQYLVVPSWKLTGLNVNVTPTACNDPELLQPQLDKFGSEGWELVATKDIATGGTRFDLYFFKRQVQK